MGKSGFGKTIILFLVITFTMCAHHSKIFAVPACDSPFELRQPSGKTFDARQYGDEWYHWVETLDGYGIYKNTATGNWEYYLPADNGTDTAAREKGRPSLRDAYRIGRTQDSKKRAIVGEADPASLGIPKKLRPAGTDEDRPIKPGPRPKILPQITPHASPLPQEERKSLLSPYHWLGDAGQILRDDRVQGEVKENAASTAVSGTKYLLVIGVDYATTAATYTPSEVQSLAFGASNSVAGYYEDVSYSSVSVAPASDSHGTQNDGFIGWLRLSGSHPGEGTPQIAKDAILAADSYIDYASYDTDGDGIISTTELSIIIIVAGYEASYSGGGSPSVWAHKWSMSTVGYPVVDGKTIRMYAEFGEKHGNHLATFGVIAHELGHLMFSLPDLYDTSYNSEGIGSFDLMAGGSWGAASGAYSGSSPTHLSAWCKEYLSWGTVNTISTGQTISLPKADGNNASIFRINTQDSNQYFLLENRQFTGYDVGFQRKTGASGHGGLVIYHIDKLRTDMWPASNEVNYYEIDKGVDVEEANEGSLGYSMLDSSESEADTNMFFFSGNNTGFTDDTTPDSRLKKGGSTRVSVTGVSAYGDTMSATVSLPTTQPLTVTTDSASNLTTNSATMQGSVDAKGVSTTVWFEYGTGGSSNDSSTSAQTVSSAGSATVSAGVSGLPSYTIYHYQLVAQTADGVRWDGGKKEFATLMDTATTVSPKIAAGTFNTLALKTDSSVWAWGHNGDGELGDGTMDNRKTPVQTHGLNGITSIAGRGFTLSLRSDGTVWGCGNNEYGQLGDGTKKNKKIPVQITGLSNITAIAAGYLHGLALTSGETVWAWGDNYWGQLGDGTLKDRTTPASVSSLSGVTAIAAGDYHTVALKSDGTVWAWGRNSYGQLGDGTTTYRSAPVQVNGISGVTAIAAGYMHTVALKSDGTVWAWGYNDEGELGDGTTTNRTTPVQVSNLNGVSAIATGDYHVVAQKSDGTVWAWGYNYSGQLGDGTKAMKYIPVQVKNLSNVTAIAAGGYHSVALKSDGTVWAWGYNEYGQLGDGTTVNRTTPVQVSGLNLGSSTSSTPTPTPSPSATPTQSDTTAPSGSLSMSGSSSYTTTTTVTLDLSATDGIGVTGYYLSESSTKPASTASGWTSVTSTTSYTGSVSFTLSNTEGIKAIYAWYKDAAGNVSNASSGSITLDTTPPTVTITSPTSGATYTATSSTISLGGTASDNTSGVSSVTWSNGKGGSGTASGTTSWSVSNVSLSSGSNVITVTAKDNAGNTATTTLTVSYGAPTPTPSPTSTPGVIATIPVGNYPFSVGINVPTNRIYVANEEDDTVSVIDGATNTVIATIPVGDSPWSVGVNGSTNRIYVANRYSNTVSVIDGATNTVASTISVGSSPHGVGVNSSTNRIYVANFSSKLVSVIDGATNTVISTISVGLNPEGVGVNGSTNRIYVTNLSSDSVSVIDGASNTVTATIEAGIETGPCRVGVNPSTNRIYVAYQNGNSTISVIDGATNTVTSTISIHNNGSVGVNASTNRIYVPDTANDTVSVIDGNTSAVVSDILVGDAPFGIGINTSTNRIYVANYCGNTISVIEDTAAASTPLPIPTPSPSPSPTYISTTPKIAAGYSHTVALKSDGTVWAWGYNYSGQLGDGTTTDRSTPVQVSGLSGVTAIAAGGHHNLALKSDGTVWAWGHNGYGQLGDGTTTRRRTPVQISGLSGVTAIAGGSGHSIALKSDGTVWAWGSNEYGQLGDGTTTHRNTPVQVSGLSGVTAIAGGSGHSIALKSDGTVRAWGRNGNGQLGDGTTTQRTTPVQVSGMNSVTAIGSGPYSFHTIALRSDGTAWAWGWNRSGMLGDGTVTQRTTPVQVTGLSDVNAFAAGNEHTIALKSDGTVWAWGHNSYGQLGDGTTISTDRPVQVSGLSGVTAIAGGNIHTIALKSDGTVWAWGKNDYGQLGDGTTSDRTTPVQVSGLNLGSTATTTPTPSPTPIPSPSQTPTPKPSPTPAQSPSPTPSATPVGTDAIAPVGSVSINGGAAYTNSTTVTLSLAATDNVGVTGYYLSENSSTPSSGASGWTAITSTTGYTASVSYTVGSGDAAKKIYAWYKDAVGNVSVVASDEITVDTAAPLVSINSPTASDVYTATSGTISLGGTALDAVSGVKDVTWTNGKGGSGTAGGTANWTVSGVSLSNGENLITVTATDNAGNTATDAIRVTYTTSVPTPTPTPQAGTGIVFGYVADEEVEPLRDVTVEVAGNGYSESETSDSDGYYEFTGVPAGIYRLTYTKEGYKPQSLEVAVSGGDKRQVETVTMEMVRKGSVSGYVQDARGNPVASVKLKFEGVGIKVKRSAKTGRDGSFEFEDLDAGTYRIVAKRNFYKTAQITVEVEEGEDMEVEIVMKKKAASAKETEVEDGEE